MVQTIADSVRNGGVSGMNNRTQVHNVENNEDLIGIRQ